MANRYFQINKHDRVVVLDGVQFKFQKLGRNFASGGFNGLIELPDGEQADLLAENASSVGAWEITEASAIAEIQKKRGSINKVQHRQQGFQENVKPVEVKKEVVVELNSVEDMLSEPEPEPEPEAVEPEPEKPPVKRKPRKSRKSTSSK